MQDIINPIDRALLKAELTKEKTVSYTHLTLPTKLEV